MPTKKTSLNLTPLTVQHIIDLIVKLATLVITAPATFTVASLIYDSRLSGMWLIIVKVAAVLLVDGVFISSIWIIENRHNLPDSEKLTNSLIVWTLYTMLLVIAIENGEGILGWIFRAAIAIYILRLTQATLAASFRRSEKQELAGEGTSLKWLARFFSLFLIMRQMLAEFSVKLRILGTRQTSDLFAIRENRDNFNMLAQDKMFLYLFEGEDGNKPLLALSGPGTVNNGGMQFYNMRRTPDGQYEAECPICFDKRHGESPRSVILLINGHLKEHMKERSGGAPLPEIESPPEFS